jgi:hypothetical protein
LRHRPATPAAANGPIRHRFHQETPMSRMSLPERPLADDEDFEAWSLDELDDFADEHSLRGSAAHDDED